MTSTHVRHPILRLDVLAPDGTPSSEHRVFCRLKRQSVGVDACCACVHCDAVTDGSAPSVHCSIPIRPLDHADDPAGDSVDVGALLCRGTVVLSEFAAVSRALGLLHEEDRRSLPVVDENSVLVGIIHEAAFVGPPGPARTVVVSAVMSTAIAVHEQTPVRVALKLMAANHLREITVVSKEGVPLGVFRDVDGLRWIAGTREEP